MHVYVVSWIQEDGVDVQIFADAGLAREYLEETVSYDEDTVPEHITEQLSKWDPNGDELLEITPNDGQDTFFLQRVQVRES